jgi:uncharacterized protein (TIGR03437 family)
MLRGSVPRVRLVGKSMKTSLFIASSLALLNSVVALAQLPVPLNSVPSRIAGHLPELVPGTINPNLVEGRELYNPVGIALDTSVSPAILYVSDNGNQRVLGWKDATAFGNGAPADLVIGQNDFLHTSTQGTGTAGGFTDPNGLAVDSKGNLYVADRGNNRILRFPRPFSQQNGQLPDMVIGQPNFNSRIPNNPSGTTSDQGLSLAGSPWPANLTFDSDQNLWVVDGGNRRVLRFTASDLSLGNNFPHANLVIGQPNATTVGAGVAASSRTTPNVFAYPFALGFDSAGRLYISDGLPDFSVGRVLVFTPPFSNGQSAARIMGVITATNPSQDVFDKTIVSPPAAVFFPGGKVGVVDAFSHRILTFDSFDQWPPQSTTFSPLAVSVFGQPDFNNRTVNGSKSTWVNPGSPRGVNVPPPTGSTISGPLGAVATATQLFLSDSGNNRVLVLPIAGSTLAPATKVFGQDNFTSLGINLVEGREVDFTATQGTGVVAEGGVAIDESGATPHLYIADTYNHRILGFRDFRTVKGGSKADIVIGQPDFNANLCNVSGNQDAAAANSLCLPMGVTVDASGNLYVADTGNSRVVRFPSPFANPALLPAADLVLGQRNFTSQGRITDPGISTMTSPYGVAISPGNGLFVSDVGANRVLYFAFTGNGTFSANDNGRAANKVFGQQNFTTATAGNTDSTLNLPRHVSVDNEARLYVADTGNNRVVIFDQINLTPNTGAHAALTLGGLSQPRGVFVNPATSEIWVAEGGLTAARRYDRFVNLLPQVPVPVPDCNRGPIGTCVLVAGGAGGALAVTQDQFGDLIVADTTNRVQFYYPAVGAFNGGHFLNSRQNVAPGMLAALCSPDSACDPNVRKNLFGPNTTPLTPAPLPVTLGDVEVWFGPQGGDLSRAPLYYVSPNQIDFVVPMGAPQSGGADVQVIQPSTGRILAAGVLGMTTVAPGIMEREYTGKFRQAAVINVEDGTVNGPANPAKKGTYVSLYATGQGFIANAPPDGQPISGVFPTALNTRVFLNGLSLDDQIIQNTGDRPKGEWLQYSGLSQFPGLWQINFYIPSSVLAGAVVGSPAGSVVVNISAGNSVISGDGTFNMVIYVK